MKDQKYEARVVDKLGTVWVFEGWIKDNPIWVHEDKARPKALTETEAYCVAISEATETDKSEIRKVQL